MNPEPEISHQIDIVSVLSEIIRKFERYNSAVETKSTESQEVAQKVLELQKRLSEAREQVKEIPGIDQSKAQQLEHLENLKKQLILKQELIEKFFASKNSEKMIEQLSDSYLMRRLAQICVSVFYRSKSIAQEATEGRLKDLNREKINSFLNNFQKNLREEAERVTKDIESKSRKQ